jgi:3-hydroxybutyryl-CoA dehydratase
LSLDVEIAEREKDSQGKVVIRSEAKDTVFASAHESRINCEMNQYKWGDLSIGMKHVFEATFTDEMARTFAELSGDVNPLHVDRDYAASAGFPSPVLFGMLTSSLYSQLVGVYLPGKFALLQGIHIDFNSPCHAHELLTVQGEITFLSEAFHRMEIKASIRKADRKLVSKALIRVGMHGE